MKNDLYNLYEQRLDLIKNNYLNNYSKREKLEKVEFKILEHYKGFELLINLKIISNNRMILGYEKITKQQKDFILLKLFDSTRICENILNLKQDSLLYKNEIFTKNWLKIKLLFNGLKENLLLCGCKL
jgi:hypothetical protein